MNKKIVNESGITLSILVLTIVVMGLLVTTIGISVSGYADIKVLKTFYNDLQIVREKTDIYYEKNNQLPVSEEITMNMVTLLGDSRNENDGEKYYKLDITLLDDMNLTYGINKTANDYYIVNEDSHNIYYYPGITVNNDTYYGIKDVSQNVNSVSFSIPSFELRTEVTATVTDGIPNIQLKVYSDVTNANISQYKFKINNEEWTLAQTQNSYIFNNLKQYETYTVSMVIIDKNGNEVYATNNETNVTIKKLPINLTIDGKTTGTYNNPLIPAGFYAVNENNAIWQSSDGYKNGLVITDEIDENGNSIGNEFVWVPVDGTNITFERQNWRNSEGKLLTYPADITIGEDTSTQYTETIPEEIVISVEKNQGFYIARYEAGQMENGKTVSKQGVKVYNYDTWINFKNAAEAMYPLTETNYGVVSTLIYGVQWDTALKFIGAYDVGEEGYNTYAINSIGMGNYNGISGGDDIASISGPAVCGSREAFRQKNIYDMAGNAWERTMELYSTFRVARGGYYGYSGSERPASNRTGSNPNDSVASNGFRVALYIK